MNILRLSTLSLALALAVFSLGYVSPSFANKPDPDTGHDHGSEVNTGTTFSVVVETDTGTPKVVTGADCKGFTDLRKLHVTFPTTCLTVHVMIGGAPYWIAGIQVRVNKSDVIFFFTSEPIDLDHPVLSETLYESSRLSYVLDELDGSSFQLEVGLTDVVLTKSHDPNKGTTLDAIAVGNIVYTAN